LRWTLKAFDCFKQLKLHDFIIFGSLKMGSIFINMFGAKIGV